MAARHGTRTRYNGGCRCDDCVAANASYHRQRRAGVSDGTICASTDPEVNGTPGPVEAAVQEEISGLAQAESRPGLVAIAAAMARVLDSTPPTPKPSAAKVLVSVLDALHKGSAQGRRGKLAVVKSMTTSSPPA